MVLHFMWNRSLIQNIHVDEYPPIGISKCDLDFGSISQKVNYLIFLIFHINPDFGAKCVTTCISKGIPWKILEVMHIAAK